MHLCRGALSNFGLESEKNPAGVTFLQWPQGYNCSYPEVVKDPNLNIWISEICNTGLLDAAILYPAVVAITVVLMLCLHLDILWYGGQIWQWTRAKQESQTPAVPRRFGGVQVSRFCVF